MFNFIGCQNFKKEKREALEYLRNKYGEEFEVDGNLMREPGYLVASKVKSTNVWPKDNPEEIFMIELYPSGEFVDDYQRITMKPYVDEYLTDMAREYWDDAAVSAKIVYGSLNEKYDENSCEKYLADSKVLTYYEIYLNYNDNFDIDVESKKIYDICNRLRALKIDNKILVVYINKQFTNEEVQEDEFWETCKSEGSIYKVFHDSFDKDIPEENKEIRLEDIKAQLKELRNDADE